MYLKKHLGFIGNLEKNTILVHNPEFGKSNMEIECDDFETVWELLCILSKSDQEIINSDLALWKQRYDISQEKYEEYIKFLQNLNLVYENEMKEETNPRMLNFLNNICASNNRYSVEQKIIKDRVAIIGLGTLGTSVAKYCLQLGVKNFLLIDCDIVEEKNMFHQSFYRKEHIGQMKTAALRNALLEVDGALEIDMVNSSINDTEALDLLIKKYNINYVFCCFDKHNKKLLTEIHENCSMQGIPVYLSAYDQQTIFASRLNANIIENINNDMQFVISENSGVGFLGDLGAQMMVRIWLQDKFEKWNIGKDLIEYNFFEQCSKNDVINLGVTACRDFDGEDVECKEFYQEKVIYPRLLAMYREYLKSYDDNLYEEMLELSQENSMSDFEFDDNDMNAYMEKVNNTYLSDGNRTYALAEFGTKYLLRQDEYDEKIIEEFAGMLKNLQEPVVYFLNLKKKNYFNDYLQIWNEKREIRDFLIEISKDFISIHFDEEIDFLKYNPLNEHGFQSEATEQVRMSAWMDDLIPGYDMREYVRYVTKHGFLDLSPRNNVSCNLKNMRYSSTDIIVHYEKSIKGFMQLCHELGHGYYASYFKNSEVEESVSLLVSETLACLNEFLAQFALIHKGKLTPETYKGLLLYLHSCIIGIFSLDLYEENILRLEEITWDNIIQERRREEKMLFGNKQIKNDLQSDYNISVSENFLFEKRVPYLYAEAYLYGFYLARQMTVDPHVYYRLINFLHDDEYWGLDIQDIFEGVLQRDMDSSFYEGLKNEFLSYVGFLKTQTMV